MKKTSIRQLYNFCMFSSIFTLICGIVAPIVLLINFNGFVDQFGKILGIIFVVVLVIGMFIVFLSSLMEITALCKDNKAMRNNNYITIIGRVIRFERNINPETGAQINVKPVVMIIDTNEEIVLLINDKVRIGQAYKFNYLPNSKIAEIVENIE